MGSEAQAVTAHLVYYQDGYAYFKVCRKDLQGILDRDFIRTDLAPQINPELLERLRMRVEHPEFPRSKDYFLLRDLAAALDPAGEG